VLRLLLGVGRSLRFLGSAARKNRASCADRNARNDREHDTNDETNLYRIISVACLRVLLGGVSQPFLVVCSHTCTQREQSIGGEGKRQ
jgi:hypothetical protein